MKKRLTSIILVITMMITSLSAMITPISAAVVGAYDERGAALAGRDVHLAWLCVKEKNLVDHYAREFIDSCMWNSYYVSIDDDQMSKIYAYKFLTVNLGDLTDYSEEELFYELLLYNNLISSDIATSGSENMVDDYLLQNYILINDSYEKEAKEPLDFSMDALDLIDRIEDYDLPESVDSVITHADVAGLTWNTATDMIQYAAYLDAVRNITESNKSIIARLLTKSAIRGTWSITLDDKPMYLAHDKQLMNAISSVLSSMETPSYADVLSDVAMDHLLPEIIEEASEKVIGKVYNGIMASTSPKFAGLKGFAGTASAVMWARDIGRLGGNILTGADAYIDATYTIINLARIEMLMSLVLEDVRNNFIYNATEKNAKELNAAYKMMLNLKYATYEYVEDYLECVYKKGIWNKVHGFFSSIFNDNRYNANYENTIDNLHSERDRLKSVIDSYEADASERYRDIINTELNANKECEVKYNANGGSGAPAAQYKKANGTLTLSTVTPTKSGCTFKGWATSSGSSTVSYKPGDKYTGSSSLTLYAVWSQNTYSIKYDANGGSGAPAAQTKYGGTPIYLSSQKPTRTGYTFMGWATTVNASKPVYIAGGRLLSDKSLYLYAVWKKSTFTITYDANYGTGAPTQQTKNAGEIVSLSTQIPTKGIYKFGGWATGDALTKVAFNPGDDYSADADLYLYAIWNQPESNPAPIIPETYTISYNSNGGSGTPASQIKTEGIPLTLSATRPTRSGYVFAGWKLVTTNPICSDGTVIAYLMPGDMFTYETDATLVAQWELPAKIEQPTEEEEFSYKVVSGKAWITSYNGNDADVIIPDTIDGYDVTHIDGSAFANKSFITSVSIPDTITDIGTSAFIGCSGLTEIDLPDALVSIGTGTFNMCYGLEEIVIPSSVRMIEYGAFYACSNLRSVFFEGDAPTVDKNAFERCADDMIIYYYLSSDGWTTPEWTDSADYSTYPTIQIDDSSRILVSGSCGDSVNWSLNGGGTLMISGSGAMDDYSKVTKVPWYDYTDDVMAIVVDEGVTYIGRNAFNGCENAKNVKLASTLTGIEDRAFTGCRSIKGISIPDKVGYIGYDVFSGCWKLKEITVDSNNTSFSTDSYGVLYDDKHNELLAFPAGSSLTTYRMRDGYAKIASYAFEGCEQLTQVILPESLEWIKSYAFGDCYGLKKMIIPSATTNIGERAFNYCENLTSVYFEGNVPTFEENVFDECSSALKLYYYAGTIGWSAPRWTDKHNVTFTTVKIGDAPDGIAGGTYGNTTWLLDTTGCLRLYGSGAMDSYINSLKGSVWSSYADDITSCIIYEGVTSIEKYALAGCKNLVSVQIPSTVTSIKTYAFAGCSSLTEISLPEELLQITANCFEGCKSLESIVIPASTYKIRGNAFNGCTKLDSVIFMGDAPAIINAGAFDGCSSEMTFYYLPESADWSTPVWMYDDTEPYAAMPLYAPMSLAPEGHTVSGEITSYGLDTDAVTVRVIDSSGIEITSFTTTSGTYSVTISSGEYVLEFSKDNHVTRRYDISINDMDVLQVVKICLLGDVNMDGFVDSIDVLRIRLYIANKVRYDDYQKELANVNGDVAINSVDVLRLRLYIAGKISEY